MARRAQIGSQRQAASRRGGIRGYRADILSGLFEGRAARDTLIRARNIVLVKALFRTLLLQPSLVDGIGKRFNSEHSNINCAPIRAVHSQRKITSA